MKPGNIILALFLVIGVFLVMMGLQIVTFSTAFVFIAILTVVALVLIAISLNKKPAKKAAAAAPAAKAPQIQIEPPKPELPKILQAKTAPQTEPAPAPAPQSRETIISLPETPVPASDFTSAVLEPAPVSEPVAVVSEPTPVFEPAPTVSEPAQIPAPAWAVSEPAPATSVETSAQAISPATSESGVEVLSAPTVETGPEKTEIALELPEASAAKPVAEYSPEPRVETTFEAAPEPAAEPAREAAVPTPELPQSEPVQTAAIEFQPPETAPAEPAPRPAAAEPAIPPRPQWAPETPAATPTVSAPPESRPAAAEVALQAPQISEGTGMRQETFSAPPRTAEAAPVSALPISQIHVRTVPGPMPAARFNRTDSGAAEVRSIPEELGLGLAQLRQQWFAAWVEGARRFNRQYRQAGIRIPLEHPRLGGEAEIAMRVFQLQLVVDYLNRYPYLRGDEVQGFLAKVERQLFGAEQEQCEAHWRRTNPDEGQATEPARRFAAHVPAIGAYLAGSQTGELVEKLLADNLEAWVEGNQLEIAQALGDKRTASKLSNRLRQSIRPTH